jgi:hypothetical protein
MRGVDVADHTKDVYSSQTRSHKWWHRLFRFLIDISTTNSFKIYNGLCDDLHVERRLDHEDFLIKLAYEMLNIWWKQRGCVLK